MPTKIAQTDLPNLWLNIQLADLENSQHLSLTALVDTGFDGFLTIPEIFAEKLDLPFLNTIRAEFAGGFNGRVEVVSGIVCVPELGTNHKWDLEIILDENNQDLLIGSSFLELLCESFQTQITLDYLNKQLIV